eukprot:734037-Hanusia_phi.AAC.2
MRDYLVDILDLSNVLGAITRAGAQLGSVLTVGRSSCRCRPEGERAGGGGGEAGIKSRRGSGCTVEGGKGGGRGEHEEKGGRGRGEDEDKKEEEEQQKQEQEQEQEEQKAEAPAGGGGGEGEGEGAGASDAGRQADVYMFDEPSSYLDVKQRIHACKAIRSLLKQDNYVVVVEHDLVLLPPTSYQLALPPPYSLSFHPTSAPFTHLCSLHSTHPEGRPSWITSLISSACSTACQ